jgi:acyl transferase domain-containing protein/acyl carrier protein
MGIAEPYDSIEGIAIIGMAGRFPGAKNLDEFWQNLRDGVESISSFTDEELIAAGIDPAVLSDANYVKAGAVLEDIELFDASFFEINPREAELTDPQHRLFLECAWEALESAGYDSQRCESRIGVYAGASLSNYYSFDLNRDRMGSAQCYQTLIGNDKDFLTTRVAYKLNLKGPSITVQSACSTSLVATAIACQSLLNYQCDMALAGGVSIRVPQKTGYVYQEGGTLSPDGHCRAFDAQAKGTTIGNGLGVVVLKRLSEAIADGDCIHAVIKGSAINNDGSRKVGYTAPSVDAQAEAIAEAIMFAEVEPETINYIEAHGTGTALGDPIEITALSKVFRARTEKKAFCAIGSLKTNIGHLDAAAGIAGLIKTVLALKHQSIPPTLNFEQPNPQIDFANSPFYVNTTFSPWKAGLTPRRAGVSSLGMGGTNAHVILEEALVLPASSPSRPWQLLVLSAKTESALETATTNLVQHLTQHPELNLADVAHTLQVGRREFNHRRMLVCRDIEDAVNALEMQDAQRVFTHVQEPCNRPIAFMFPGQGAQYVDMGKELYQTEATFKEQVDRCCELLKPHLGIDLRSLIYPIESEAEGAAEKLKQTAIAQPALFVIEYALAQLWMSWGISPQAMIGHSLGEYVAACLAEVMSLEDALALVAVRGRLMQQLPTGAMLAVSLPASEVETLLDNQLSLAASNAPASCVVSGTHDAINAFQNKLLAQGIDCRHLHTSHAFHSPMMDAILEPFIEEVKKVKLNPPKIPFVSNVTGTWIITAQATDPNYWAQHLRQTVRFSSGITQLLQEPNRILLEVGSGCTLCSFAKKHLNGEDGQVAIASLRHPKDEQSDVAFLLNALGKLWLSGVEVDWSRFYTDERRHRLPLPTYPFERERYWIERQKRANAIASTQDSLTKKPDIADWFYVPVWKQSVSPALLEQKKLVAQNSCTLIFVDECGLGEALVKQLELEGQDVITVAVGSGLTNLSECAFALNPRQGNDYEALLKELLAQNKLPKTIVHLWSVTPYTSTTSELKSLEESQAKGFYSLLFLAQALGKQNTTDEFQITVISNNLQSVTGLESLCPEKATVLGAVKVIPQEYPNISCRSIDVGLTSPPTPLMNKRLRPLSSPLVGENERGGEGSITPPFPCREAGALVRRLGGLGFSAPNTIPLKGTWEEHNLTNQLLAELTAQSPDSVIAYRGLHRWVQTFEPVRLNATPEGTPKLLKEGGVYLITGGLGGIGLAVAEYLAQTVQAKLILVSRSALPNRDEWEKWLVTHTQQDSVSHKIRKVQQLEKLGAEVLVVSADVTELEPMRKAIALAHPPRAIATAQQEFGQIDGVIHAAGVPGGGMIQRKTLEEAERILAPKVKGTLVLHELFKNTQLDFLVICSSLSSILGGFGQVDYAGANAFLDTFAHWNYSKNGTFTISINWDTWQEVGMAVNTAVPLKLQSLQAENLKEGILPNEGAEALGRILGVKLPQVLVSTRNFQMRVEREKDLGALLSSEILDTANLPEPTHSRPNLNNAYIAPRNEIEQTLVNIWQGLLGIENVGIYDNFFELGGDSLMAVRVIAQVREAFQIELSLSSLFENQNVAGMAESIERVRGTVQTLQSSISTVLGDGAIASKEADREEITL